MILILPLILFALFIFAIIIIMIIFTFYFKEKNNSDYKNNFNNMSYKENENNLDFEDSNQLCDINNTIKKTVNRTLLTLNDKIDNKIKKQIDNKMDKLLLVKQNLIEEPIISNITTLNKNIPFSKRTSYKYLTKKDFGPELSTRANYCGSMCLPKNRITEKLQLRPTILSGDLPNVMTAENFYKVNILNKPVAIMDQHANSYRAAEELHSGETMIYANPYANDKILSQNTKGLAQNN